ncbi:MAG: hypothetical protein QOE33_1810 [Acidobacteriota bacterium]|nr:hypothetical protein [Acidobacteriota bacterium]
MTLSFTFHARRVLRAAICKSLVVVVASCVFTSLLCSTARAQELVLPPQPAPPPMRYVPEAERARLAVADPKERVHATLDLLEDRLSRAERETAATHYDAATANLGIYQALLDDVLRFLKPVGRSPDGRKVNGTTRDLYKHIEMMLNRHTARIEAVRRLTPADYQRNVRDAFLYARDKRTECLDAFFGASVLREPDEAKPPNETTPPHIEL